MTQVISIVHPYQQKQYAEEISNQGLILKQRNWKHTNGRINATIPGQPYTALTVSPYASDFETQIEDGVKDLVFALRDKGYLTVSSCQGHRWKDCARVVIAFGQEGLRNEFVNYINNLPVPYTQCVSRNSISNISSQRYGNKLVHLAVESDNSINESNWFNLFFCRNYTRYYFCEIKVWTFKRGYGPLALITNYKIWKYKKEHQRQVMTQLVNCVNQYKEYLL